MSHAVRPHARLFHSLFSQDIGAVAAQGGIGQSRAVRDGFVSTRLSVTKVGARRAFFT
jgi:hypothetical protein